MLLTRLEIAHFRNLHAFQFKPQPKINWIVGPNGSGKTSILEAITVCSRLKSFRENKVLPLIHWDQQSCHLTAQILPFPEIHTEISIGFEKTTGSEVLKLVKVNDKTIRSGVEFLKLKFEKIPKGFHVVGLSPSDHELVQGEASLRRQYFDRMLSAFSSEYLETLSQFKKIVDQKSLILKQWVLNPSKSIANQKALIAPYDDLLISNGSLLVLKRLELLGHFKRVLDDFLRTSDLKFDLGYEIRIKSKTQNHFTGQDELPSLEKLKSLLRESLEKSQATEWTSGQSLVGAHRDDWSLSLNGRPVKLFGSQGETRFILASIKFAEIELFKFLSQTKPILLLDDFSSELDFTRREFLLNTLQNSQLQVFVTSTQVPHQAAPIFWMDSGNLKQ